MTTSTGSTERVPIEDARRLLADLTDGALRWLAANLAYFDPFALDSPLPQNRRFKAMLELTIFCRAWAGQQPPNELHERATALLCATWARPELPLLIETHGGPFTAAQRLAYLALAPNGQDGQDRHRTTILARLQDEGYLEPLGTALPLKLEIRYLAELAGVEHGMPPSLELAAQSLLTRLPTAPMSTEEAYTLTHTAFYLADYGCRAIALPPDRQALAVWAVGAVLASCVRQQQWDLTGELLVTMACLGADVAATPAGRAGIVCLARAQRPHGAISGRSAGSRVDPLLPPGPFFRRAYHTTLVVGLLAATAR